ncbi:MFS transporter, partial [Streptomyces albiflaviniger]|nr:MFS transporter [Streptomyces albiflaviniger]
VGGFIVLGFGLETTLFSAYESMLNEASSGSAGGAAAIGETSYQLGAGIGIALLGSVMNAAYKPGVSSVPGVPAYASSDASQSLGAAYKVSDRLGGHAGEALRSASRAAFVHGLHVTLAVSAGLLLLGALAALRLPKVMECAADDEESAEGPSDQQGSAEQRGTVEQQGPADQQGPDARDAPARLDRATVAAES